MDCIERAHTHTYMAVCGWRTHTAAVIGFRHGMIKRNQNNSNFSETGFIVTAHNSPPQCGIPYVKFVYLAPQRFRPSYKISNILPQNNFYSEMPYTSGAFLMLWNGKALLRSLFNYVLVVWPNWALEKYRKCTLQKTCPNTYLGVYGITHSNAIRTTLFCPFASSPKMFWTVSAIAVHTK